MKYILIAIIIFISLSSFCQKTALLSKDFKKPILYTDSLTVEQVTSGYFPVTVKDFDTLVGSLNYLKNIVLQDKGRIKVDSWEFRSGNTILKINRIPYAYGDGYSVIASSKIDEIRSIINLTPEKNDKRNAKHLEEMIDYIAKNRSIFKGAYEIIPKYYEIIIMKE